MLHYASLLSENTTLTLESGIGSSMSMVIGGRIISGTGGAGMTSLVAVIITGWFM
jgi:hypothetical protein